MEFHDILNFDAGKSCEKRRDAEIINEPIFILLFLSWKASPTTTTTTAAANSTKVQILRHEENGSNNKETTKLDTVVFSNGDVQAKEEEGGKGDK